MKNASTTILTAAALAAAAAITAPTVIAGAHVAETLYPAQKATTTTPPAQNSQVTYATLEIDSLDIFFREAGDPSNPTIVLLHGFPTSSHMFRDLIPLLADDFHVIAPDYPGYGLSSAPTTDEWDYSFDNFANVVDELLERKDIDNYALYVMDYGAPVGYRIATEHPERVTGLIVQNGNAYDEGLKDFWNPIKAYWAEPNSENRDALRGLLTLGATTWQYHHGTRNPENISPDNWLVIQPLLDRPGNNDIQLDMFLDYSTNPPSTPSGRNTSASTSPRP